MAIPLETSVTATFTGNDPTDSFATAEIANARAGITWRVRRIVVSSDSDILNPPEMYMYRNYESPTTLLDSTRSGNADTSETDITLRSNEKLLFRWFKGTVGATATVSLSGDIY